jgi:hypothetical protein
MLPAGRRAPILIYTGDPANSAKGATVQPVTAYRATRLGDLKGGELFIRRTGPDQTEVCLMAQTNPVRGGATYYVSLAVLSGEGKAPTLHLTSGQEDDIVAELLTAEVTVDASADRFVFLRKDPAPGQLVLMQDGRFVAVLPESSHDEKLVEITTGAIRDLPSPEGRITISNWSITLPQSADRLALATFPIPAVKP